MADGGAQGGEEGGREGGGGAAADVDQAANNQAEDHAGHGKPKNIALKTFINVFCLNAKLWAILFIWIFSMGVDMEDYILLVGYTQCCKR